ncbi:hypothetical protein BBP40_002068 [Aspergillus hancockii]|nr:hypothetical protein BBP40_002068 [Aspergillus hancockii]
MPLGRSIRAKALEEQRAHRQIPYHGYPLIGHGTGKLLSETKPRIYNFDKQNPPISPLTGAALEECRDILVSEYLMDGKELLGIFGYTDTSEITTEDLLYTTYLNIGVNGFSKQNFGLSPPPGPLFHPQTTPPRRRRRHSHFPQTHHSSLTVQVARTKFLSHSEPALGCYLCRLHIWRCAADLFSCAQFYETLCAVDGVYKQWRQIVYSRPNQRWKFVQLNTFVNKEIVEMKVYEGSNEGIIQSWVEREV